MSDQQSINEAEWADPDNWSGPKWLSVYFSKRDSRTWVPKQIPSMGWTINLGRPAGAAWFFGVVLFTPMLAILILVCLLLVWLD